jgi:hypothetical protein
MAAPNFLDLHWRLVPLQWVQTKGNRINPAVIPERKNDAKPPL